MNPGKHDWDTATLYNLINAVHCFLEAKQYFISKHSEV